jgi:hypothetical protein
MFRLLWLKHELNDPVPDPELLVTVQVEVPPVASLP